tara:strand:- start:220 stop:672 length:453 start_codon:yes stop_codon:yes gene_type:complete
MNFSLGVKKFAEKTGININKVIVATSSELFTNIIKGTPVDTGRLRGNWQPSIGSPITSRIGAKDASGQGEASISKVTEVLNQFSGDGSVFLSNNLPYAYKIEYGLYPNPPKNPTGKTVNGFSTQAPKGMVRVSIRRVKAAMTKAIRNLPK